MSEFFKSVCPCKDYSESNLVIAEAVDYWASRSMFMKCVHFMTGFFTFGIWFGYIIARIMICKTKLRCTECGSWLEDSSIRSSHY